MNYTNYNYGYNSVTVLNNEVLPNRIKGSTVSLGAKYNKKLGEFHLSGEFLANISGDFEGNMLTANGKYKFNDDIKVKASLILKSSAPNYNYLLYKSDYINYNWNNVDSFENESTRQFVFELESSKIANVAFDFTNIDNYTLHSFLQ